MRKLAFVGIILQPSVASAMSTLAIGCLLFLSALFNLGGSNDQFFRLLLGPDSSIELISSTESTFTAITQTLFDNPTVNKILFFSFWLLVGLVVYIFISGTGAIIGAAQQFHEEAKMIHAHRAILEKELGLRIVLRSAALLAWILYMVVFFKLFLPFTLLAFQVATQSSFSISNTTIGVLGFVVILVSLHLHVVLLRCFMLRPRIIGGWDDIIAAHLT